MPRVYNRRTHKVPATAVDIARPSIWGNPFAINGTRDRTAAIETYAAWLMRQPEMVERAKRELRGKDLVCWCAPLPCHGDVLLRIANDD